MSRGSIEVGQIEMHHAVDPAQARGWSFEVPRRALSLRAGALTRAVCKPWRWLRTRVERLRAPMDFRPV